jgi:hypothetical protein
MAPGDDTANRITPGMAQRRVKGEHIEHVNISGWQPIRISANFLDTVGVTR